MIIHFEPFLVDSAAQILTARGERLALRPRSYDVLLYLIHNRHRCVARAELLAAVWGDAMVCESNLSTCIAELRSALGDQARDPKYILTLHRRGYRFVGTISDETAPPPEPPCESLAESLVPVGRRVPWDQLKTALAEAARGSQRVVFLAGEAGIGKTTLVDAFLTHVEREMPCRIARGQCVGMLDYPEPYLAIADALSGLAGEPGNAEIAAIIRQCCPEILVGSVANQSARLPPAAIPISQDRTRRRVVEAIERIADGSLLVLVVEDLHWVDDSTLAVIDTLARHRPPFPLLLIGTARRDEDPRTKHSLTQLKAELLVHSLAEELVLERLSHDQVTEAVARRRLPRPLSKDVVASLQQRSEGNPLFLELLIDHLLQRQQGGGAMTEQGPDAVADDIGRALPERLRVFVEAQLAALSGREREALLAASAIGPRVPGQALAAALDTDSDTAENLCAELARHDLFLRWNGSSEWPDGSIEAEFSFRHALYCESIYATLGAARRQRLHGRIAERLEKGFVRNRGEVAGQLAVHHAGSGNFAAAAECHRLAGTVLAARFAVPLALGHMQAAIQCLQQLPPSGEVTRKLTEASLALGTALVTARGHAHPSVRDSFEAAFDTASRVSDAEGQMRALIGLRVHLVIAGECRRAIDLEKRWPHSVPNTDAAPSLFALWRLYEAQAHLYLGRIGESRSILSKLLPTLRSAAEIYAQQRRTMLFWMDPSVVALMSLAAIHQISDAADAAAEAESEALSIARDGKHPYVLAYTMINRCMLLLAPLQRWDEVETAAREVLGLANEHGFPLMRALAEVYKALAMVEAGDAEDGADCLHRALTAYESTGAKSNLTVLFAHAADSLLRAGRLEDCGRLIESAFAYSSKFGEAIYLPELWCLRGRLTWATSGASKQGDMVGAFATAISLARGMGARWLRWRIPQHIGLMEASDAPLLGDRRRLVATLKRMVGTEASWRDVKEDEAGGKVELGTDARND